MNLATFLDGARNAGHTQLRVSSPRGYDLLAGSLDGMTPDELQAKCSADANPLPSDRKHEYVVHVASPDAAKTERFALRVSGGSADRGSEHYVEPSTVTTSAAVVGHLVRALVDAMKQNTALCMKISEHNSQDKAELEKSRRAAMRNGEVDLVRIQLEREHEEARQQGETVKSIASEGIGMLKMLAGRISPEAAANVLADARESLTEEQHGKASETFGAATWGRILAARNADAVVAILMKVPPAKFNAFQASLTERQQQLFVGALSESFKRATSANGAEAS